MGEIAQVCSCARVYPCIPVYTRVYPCIPVYTRVCPCMPVYTRVYPCIQARKVFQFGRLSDRFNRRRIQPEKCASKMKEIWTKTLFLPSLASTVKPTPPPNAVASSSPRTGDKSFFASLLQRLLCSWERNMGETKDILLRADLACNTLPIAQKTSLIYFCRMRVSTRMTREKYTYKRYEL